MGGRRKQKKDNTKDKAPKGPPPAPPKPPNSKLMLRVPPLVSATAQALPPQAGVSTGRTPELAPEAGPLPPEEDSDIDISDIPYVASPRQELADQFWDDHASSDMHNQNEDLGSELLPTS